ncbi:MAG: hypothetical protein LW863_06600, partial [Flammeovirgaceae bacterium]|nr:hypothetical protein [Flammeovirgaceae bacterium]
IAGEVLQVKGDVEALKKRMVDLNEKKKRDKAKSNGSSFEGVDIKFEGTIDSLYVNEAGEVIAVLASKDNSTNGSSQKEERKIDTKKGADNRITDDSGNVYVVGKDGTIEKMGSTGASGTSAVASNVNYRVDFESSSNQAYGFDQQQHSEHERNYEKYERDGKIYTIPWKSVASGSRDIVIAKSTESRKDFSKEVIYKTDNGLLLRRPGNQENEVQLTVEGFGDQSTEQVTAYYKRKDADGKEKEVMVGKLNLVSYDKLVERLVIVSVNNTAPNISTTELAESLNTIFAPAAVEWTVESQSITGINYDTNGKSGLDDGSSGIFSNYTGEMRTVINAYKDQYDIAKNTWYLFLVPNSESGRTQGFMPRKKQAGFIFMEQLGETSLAKVIGHEIGHGAFRLEHSFDTYNTIEKYSTDNLMDYQPSGITLHKYQWDLIHDPAAVLGLFEGDEGGAMVAKKTTGKLVVTISNTTLAEGKVYVNESSIKQIKVKFEIADTTKTKVLYQLTCITSSKNTTINHPKTGYDTLVYNQVEEINFDSIPQGKYKLVCKVSKKEYVLNFIVRNKKLEITSTLLKAIFPTTDDKRIAEVVKTINEYSAAYDISTPERMAHFIGQIGAETGGLKDLKESHLYTPRTILKIFPFVKYGHLFEIVGLDSNSYVYNYSSINYDENKCDGKKIDRGNAVFPLKNDSEIINAYAATKSDTLEILIGGKKSKILIYKKRTDVTTENIEQQVKDAEYNNGILKVKPKYIRSSVLFDVTYACRMGNGAVTSKDGSTYLGKGFIHITGKDGYQEVSEEWNKLYPKDKKEFHGKDINLLETNVEIAIKASMVYWRIRGLNTKADQGTSETIVEEIGRIVNGGDNGMDKRKKHTKLAAKTLK